MRTRIALAGFLVIGLARPAFAHAFLQHASPGAGQTVAAPKEIDMAFSEKLEPSLSGVSITDAAGHDVGAQPAMVKDATITVALPPLKPGAYKVNWHAVSVDSHRTEGDYRFTVQP